MNDTIPGTIEIENGSLTWRRFFTRLSLSLNNTVLIDEEGEELIRVSELGAVVNPLALIGRRIEVNSLLLSGVDIDLGPDSSGRINLLVALGIEKTEAKSEEISESNKAPGGTPEHWKKWSVDIGNVRFENCRAHLIRAEGSASVLLEFLELTVKRVGEDGQVSLAFAFSEVRSDGLGPGYFRDKRYELNLDISMNRGIALIESGGLNVGDARIDVGGQCALFFPYEADISVKTRGADTDLLLSFLPPGVELGDVVSEGNGEIVIDGYLKGPIVGDPKLGVDVICTDFGLTHVPTGTVMNEIGFVIAARIGGGNTFLEVNNLTAVLPDGHIRADLQVENLLEPQISLKLDGSLNLATLTDFFVFPGSGSIAGQLDMRADVAGQFDSSGRLLERERETGEIRLSDFRYQLPTSDFEVSDLDLVFSLDYGKLDIRSFKAITDIGNISLDGSFGGIWPLLFGGEGPLRFEMEFSSPLINPAALFSDPIVAASWDEDYENLSLGFSFDTTVEQLKSADPIPEGTLLISDFSGRVPKTGKELKHFSGAVEISDQLSAAFRGQLQDSTVQIELGVSGYKFLLNSDIAGTVTTKLTLEAPLIKVEDFLPVQPSDGESLNQKSITDFFMDLELTFKNSDWFSSFGSWPEGRWILHKLEGRAALVDMPIYLSFDLISDNNRADLTDFTAIFGDSDVFVYGYLNDIASILGSEIQNLSGNLVLESQYLNMSDFVIDTDREETDIGSDEDPAWEIGGRPYPDLEINLQVSEFLMEPIHLRDIQGQITTSSEGFLELNKLSFNGRSGGRADISGTIDLSRSESFKMEADISIQDLRLEATAIPMKLGGETQQLGEMIKGTLTGRVGLDSVINPDLSIDLGRSTLNVRAELQDGRLVNFPPLVAMADRYRNRNMRDVRIDTLELKTRLKDGRIELPKTAVGSTLGYLEVEGYSLLGSFMSYSITVPNSTIDDVVTGMIFGGGKDDEVEDEIINAENSSRGRTTINVVGSPDNIIIGVGKRGRGRLEDRWNRQNDRRTRREN